MVDNDVRAIGVCACCCLCVIIGISLGINFSIHLAESCTQETFHDLPDEFWVEELFWTNRARSKIYDSAKHVIGSFTTKPSITTAQYRYRDLNDNVVAQVDHQALTWTDQYEIIRCRLREGSTYYIEQYFFTIGEIKYDLSQNGSLAAITTQPTFFTCKPDITLSHPVTKEVIATIDRSCGKSFFADKWHIKNLQPNPSQLEPSDPTPPARVENYVLGFIAYITTQKENQAESEADERRRKQNSQSNTQSNTQSY